MLKLDLPIFCPDATRAAVKSVDSRDLQEAGVLGVIVNTFHLSNHPGLEVVKTLGGVKKMMDFDGLVISDSGGFQVMSLIHQQNIKGDISDKGITFVKKSGKRVEFTPEKSIQMQFAIGSDVMVALDDCPMMDASEEEVARSVDRTIAWAKRSKAEFDLQMASHLGGVPAGHRPRRNAAPLLFGVIQGGNSKKERERCAKALVEIGFDGYGFGGWPMKTNGELNSDILKFTADLMPDDKPKYALGLGNPEAMVECFGYGYNIFDCVLPTRDARHKRLYLFNTGKGRFYKTVRADDEKFTRDGRPIEEGCKCFTCQKYSRAYIKHLFDVGDRTAERLATIHNLHFYQQVIGKLK